MREREFREFLRPRLGEGTVSSYVAYCNRLRRDLHLQLDSCDLSAASIANIGRDLEATGAPQASVRNCLSALRAYAEFRGEAGTSRESSKMRITPEQRDAWQANTSQAPFNRWLDAQVRLKDGTFVLDRLYNVAEAFGIRKRGEYAGLNLGQQRMNLGNMLRRVVPPSVYENSEAPQETPTLPPSREVEVSRATPEPIAIVAKGERALVQDASVSELLALYGQIMDELRSRDIVRTGNSPVGDYAELLFARAFGWTLEGNSAAGHDATDAQGVRYQIKARRLAKAGASRQLSAIRRLNDHTFDYLAAVLFDGSFKVLRAILVPHALVAAKARRTDHTNSWQFILDDRLWLAEGVRDVTADLAVAASRV